jgi:transcriptional regulator with XRE-family HTH domain
MACPFATLSKPMARAPARSVHLVLGDARRVLGMTQNEFGSALGSSHRTAVRWDAGQSSPGAHELRTLAGLLHPRDRSLAIEVAQHLGETLETLGLETPPPPPAPAPPQPPQPPPTRPEDLVDIVVCAAVEVTGSMPSALRPLLYAVFKRAREVGLTMQAVENALRPVVETATKPPHTNAPKQTAREAR